MTSCRRAFNRAIRAGGFRWAMRWSSKARDDLALGVDPLYRARTRYPWFEMQTLYSFDVEGISRAVADAMVMHKVKSTIMPWPELLA